MHNNPIKRTKHKHSRGLSIQKIVKTIIMLIASIILWGATISNIITGDNITYGIITMITTNNNDINKYDVTIEYKVGNKEYTTKVVSSTNHYEGEEVIVNYDKDPHKIYINDETNNIHMKVGIFTLLAGIFTLFTLINIISIIIFLLKFVMIRVFFN